MNGAPIHVPREIRQRLGRGQAAIQLLSKGDLAGRLDAMAAGTAPRDFFYGFLGLMEKGYDARFQRTDAPYAGLNGLLSTGMERLRARLTGFSERDRVIEDLIGDWYRSRLMLSFTDHFSLTLGRVMKPLLVRPFAIGIFHGLSDIEGRLPGHYRKLGYSRIWRSLAGLDHIAFLGPADRDEAVARYGLAPERTSIFAFGIDTDFWCPGPEPEAGPPFVLAVGSDPSRDYDSLLAAPITAPLRIVTRLDLRVPPDRTRVEVIRGHYFDSPLDDLGLRRLYRQAAVVVLPLKDVFQPTGQSVCLQAMACGCPVVLSDIRGLWSPGLYVDGIHGRLVPPGDPAALAEAVNGLLAMPDRARAMGEEARRVTLAHHNLDVMNRTLEDLVCRAPGIERR